LVAGLRARSSIYQGAVSRYTAKAASRYTAKAASCYKAKAASRYKAKAASRYTAKAASRYKAKAASRYKSDSQFLQDGKTFNEHSAASDNKNLCTTSRFGE